MKKVFLLFTSTLFFISSQAQITSTNTCISSSGGGGGGGNVAIFANYDGGVLNINVDQNIPNLKIGVCTYEPVTINILGPFAGNVTEVRYAGYVTTSNNHCFNSPPTTTITGVPAGITSVLFMPPATSSNPNGYPSIICGYSCDTTTSQGGCNTADQLRNYFTTTMGGSLLSYFTQYGCWSVTNYNISAGGNCVPAVSDTTTSAFMVADTNICIGEALNFTDISPGAVSWSWSAPGASTTSAVTQNFNGISWSAPGTYTVTLTVNDGDGTCSTSQNIHVRPAPPVTATANDSMLCPQDTTTLMASGAAGYVWTGGPSTANWTLAPSSSTTYTVTGTDIYGCTNTATVHITISPVPSAPSISYTGGELHASPTPAGAEYQWFLDGNPIAGANDSTYTPVQNGVYTVSIIINGCESNNSLGLTVMGLGIEDNNQPNALHIFPNPGSGIFNVQLNISVNTELHIQVMDMTGRVVYTKNVQGMAGNSSYQVDLTGLAKGVYELKLSNGKYLGTGKIMIE